MTPGEKLIELMDWLGVNQADLARATGIGASTISSYTTGRVSMPFEAAVQLAQGLGVSPWALLNGSPLPANTMDLTQAELDHLSDLRTLTEQQRELLDDVVRRMKQQNETNRLKKQGGGKAAK